jgi:hypothetical protein
MAQFLSVVNCTGIDLGSKYCHRMKAMGFKSYECPGQELELHVYNLPAYRIIIGRPLTHLMTIIWWSTIVLKPRVKTHIERYII